MPMFRFPCPSCGFILSAPEDTAGRASKCPKCAQRLTIPNPWAIPQIAPPPPSAPPPSVAASSYALSQPCAIPTQVSGKSSGFLRVMLWVFLPALLLIGGLGYYWFFHLARTSPLSPYATLVPDDAVLALEVNLAEIANTVGFDADALKLAKAFNTMLKQLDLEPKSAAISRFFTAAASKDRWLAVWCFDQPIGFGRTLKGRFQEIQLDSDVLLKDRYIPKMHWAVDQQGRLLLGPRESIKKALERVRSREISVAATTLLRAAQDIPGVPLCFLAADPSDTEKGIFALLPALVASDFRDARISGLSCFVTASEEQGLMVKGRAFCPTISDSQSVMAGLQNLRKNANKLVAGKLDWRPVGKLLSACKFEAQEKTIEMEAAWPVADGRRALAWISDSIMSKQKAIAQAITQDRVELLTRADAHFLKEEFKEADEVLGRALDLVPGDPSARDKRNKVKISQDRKEKFDSCIKAFDKAVTTRDFELAQSTLAQARTLRGHDRVLPDLEKQLKTLERELEFERLVGEGNKAIALKKFAEAVERFQQAQRFGFKAKEMTATVEALDRIMKADDSLKAARSRLAKKEIDEVFQQVEEVKKHVLGNFRSKLDEDERFRATVEKIAEDTLDILVGLVKEQRLLSQVRKKKGEKLSYSKPPRYADAETEYRAGIEQLSHGKKLLTKAVAFSLKDKFNQLNKEKEAVDDEYKSLEREAETSKGLASQQQGKELASQGRDLFAEARKKKDAALFQAAREKFMEAARHFKASLAVPGILAKGDLKNAEDHLIRIGHVLQPLDLDFAKARDLKSWGPPSSDWTFRTDGKLVWLQTELKTAEGSLSSPELDLPLDFELRLQFCMVTDGAILRNEAWNSVIGALRITLITNAKERLEILIGKLPMEVQNLSGILVGSRKRAKVLHLESTKAPISLVLSQHQGDLLVTVADKLVDTVGLTGELRQIIFHVRNGTGPQSDLRYFPALTRIQLGPALKPGARKSEAEK